MSGMPDVRRRWRGGVCDGELVIQRGGVPGLAVMLMLDGGSGRCEALLRPPGTSEQERRKIKSLTCSGRSEVF